MQRQKLLSNRSNRLPQETRALSMVPLSGVS